MKYAPFYTASSLTDRTSSDNPFFRPLRPDLSDTVTIIFCPEFPGPHNRPDNNTCGEIKIIYETNLNVKRVRTFRLAAHDFGVPIGRPAVRIIWWVATANVLATNRCGSDQVHRMRSIRVVHPSVEQHFFV